MKRACALSLVSFLLLPACGGSDSRPDGGAAQPCQAGELCLDVKKLSGSAAVPAGRLGILWVQLNDNVTAAPLVAHDAAFDPSATEVHVPLASLAQPDEANLLCQRSCTDGASCPCTGGPRVGLAVVVVLADSNGNQHIDAAETVESNAYGYGYVVLGYSAVAQGVLDPPFDYLFPEGIDAGTAPYRVLKHTDTFDGLGKVTTGTRFDLNVCAPTDSGCDLPTPNLS